jgi:hypothetical protein
VGGAHISVGNLHWSLTDPKTYFAGVINMIGSAKLTILFVPVQALPQVKQILKTLLVNSQDSVLIEREVPFRTGRRNQPSNHVYRGSFICFKGQAFAKLETRQSAFELAVDQYFL